MARVLSIASPSLARALTFPRGWQFTLAVLFIAQVLSAVGFSMIFPFLPLYIESLGSAGGFSTATHLHIARRYNGEWLPADCNRCPVGADAPPFVMSGWKVVGLGSQLYQGFLVNIRDNRSVIAEQGRHTDVNTISW